MDYIDILQEMLRYIDLHIKEELSAEKLAARAGFSPYHFRRIFLFETGIPLMGYVRSRRLAFAVSELVSGRRIIDIAVDYGFETHSGFTKAFRRYFGCTPEVYRTHATFDVPKLPIIERTKLYVNGGIVMEPKMLKRPGFRLAGYVLTSKLTIDGQNSRAIPKFWDDVIADGRQEKLHHESFVKSHTEYGACFPENPENGEFEYVIGCEVKEGYDVPQEYHTCTIPEATYAVFSIPPTDKANFSPTIQGTWNYIMSEWFPASGYEFAPDGVDFELYDERAQTGKMCDIYIPVVKKGT